MGNCLNGSSDGLAGKERSDSVSDTGRRKSITNQLLSVVTIDELKGAEFSGHLWKKSDWKHEWRERHLILHGSIVHNFKGTEKSSTEGLHLNESSTVSIVETDGPPSITKSFCFEIGGSKHWTCAATNSGDRDKWIEHINNAINNITLKKRFHRELKAVLIRGGVFQKYHHDTFANLRNKDRKRVVKMDNNCQNIQWHKIEELNVHDELSVKSIKEAKSGKHTNAFRGTTSLKSELCFSIISSERTLDLVAESVKVRDLWVDAINGLVKFGGTTDGGDSDQPPKEEESRETVLLRTEKAIKDKRNDETREKFQELLNKNKKTTAKKKKK